MVALLFCFGAAVQTLITLRHDQFLASIPQFAVAGLIVVSLAVSALKIPEGARGISGDAPNLWLLGGVALLAGSVWLVPYQGGALGRNGERGQILSHEEAVQKWVAFDQCAAPPAKEHISDKTSDGTSIDIATYDRCAEGAEVRDYSIVEGGHTWPGGLQYMPVILIGKTTKNLDASEVIWKFLLRHSR